MGLIGMGRRSAGWRTSALLRLAASRRRIHGQQSVADAVLEVRSRLNLGAAPSSLLSGDDSPRNDAKALVANALQPRLAASSDVFFHSDRQLTEDEAEALAQTVEMRARGEPLAYVLGRKEFWSMEFVVSKDTLIPRSDSEVLIETLVDQFPKQTPLRILDIGTGSGCLLLSALAGFPLATGVGIDISPDALAVAQQNAVNNALDQRAQFLHRDLETLPRLKKEATADEALFRRFDVILCNPPYIPRRELHLIAPDVLKYEPHLALFADGGLTASSSPTESDPDGLRMYQLLQKSIAKLFRSDPTSSPMAEATAPTDSPSARCLLMEIGSEAQARAVQKLFTASATSQTASRDSANERLLKFERFLFDASGKYRGLLFLAP